MFELKASQCANDSGLTDEAVRLVEHARECLQRCKRLETCVSQLQHEAENDSLFPIIVSRRPPSVGSHKEKSVNGAR